MAPSVFLLQCIKLRVARCEVLSPRSYRFVIRRTISGSPSAREAHLEDVIQRLPSYGGPVASSFVCRLVCPEALLSISSTSGIHSGLVG